jgi:hypothetical protein
LSWLKDAFALKFYLCKLSKRETSGRQWFEQLVTICLCSACQDFYAYKLSYFLSKLSYNGRSSHTDGTEFHFRSLQMFKKMEIQALGFGQTVQLMRQISSGAQLRVNLIMEWVSCGQAKQTLG